MCSRKKHYLAKTSQIDTNFNFQEVSYLGVKTFLSHFLFRPVFEQMRNTIKINLSNFRSYNWVNKSGGKVGYHLWYQGDGETSNERSHFVLIWRGNQSGETSINCQARGLSQVHICTPTQQIRIQKIGPIKIVTTLICRLELSLTKVNISILGQ